MLVFTSPLVYGQGITINSPIVVSQAIDLPDNSWVILNGNIINSLPGGSQYTFRDSTGEVIVEIDWPTWRGLNIMPAELVQIHGELNNNTDSVSIRVRAIYNAGTLVSRPGQVIFTNPITISEAISLPHDSWVIFIGTIVNVLQGGRHYAFRDSTGEMTVEIDQNVWRGLYVDTTNLIQITGEIVANGGQPSLVVRVIRKIH